MRVKCGSGRLCVRMLVSVVLFGWVWVPEAQAQALADVGEHFRRQKVGSPVNEARIVPLAQFDSAPTIDGNLDEEVWQKAARLVGFRQTEPGDNIAPTYQTEVLIGYDSNSLYLGIRAFDNPDKIRATVARRDSITSDDTVAVYLDTFNDRRRAYVLMFNPLGVQQDGIYVEGNETDFSFDIVMQSKGVIDGNGYSIEVAIPFKSLRYEAGKGKLWGVHVLRQIKHLDEENSWMPLRRDKARMGKVSGREVRARFLAQAGQITGLENIATERTLEIIPVLTISETGRRVSTLPHSVMATGPAPDDPGRLVNQPVAADLGVTAKLTLTPSVALDLAVNPDFAEVEADQPQITANQRFPLFFEEKRPFFLEGIDIFRTPLQAVHTRTIIDPDVAMKLSGKRGRTSFGLMLASDRAPGNFSEEERADPQQRPEIERLIDKNAHIGVLRVRRDVGELSSLGVIATSYNFIERHNQLTGIDGRISVSPDAFLTFQLLGTTSRRYFYSPDEDKNIYRTGDGFGYFVELGKTGRHLNVLLTGEGYTPDYRADVGFTERTNINQWSIFARYNSEPKQDSTLISWSLLYTYFVQGDWQGRMNYSYNYPRIFLNFKRRTFINFFAYRDYTRLFEEEFGAKRTLTRTGAFAGESERRDVYKGFTLEAGTAPSKKYSFNILIDNTWDFWDYDFGAGPRFPRVSPAALSDPNAPLDPGPGRALQATASAAYQPTDTLRLSLAYTKSNLVRNDTGRTAFDQEIYSLRANYYFTRFIFARARADYDTLKSNVSGQFLFGWTPNPGTAFYAGYNDDLNFRGFSPLTGRFEPGFHRNRRTFFIKFSYLIRWSFD